MSRSCLGRRSGAGETQLRAHLDPLPRPPSPRPRSPGSCSSRPSRAGRRTQWSAGPGRSSPGGCAALGAEDACVGKGDRATSVRAWSWCSWSNSLLHRMQKRGQKLPQTIQSSVGLGTQTLHSHKPPSLQSPLPTGILFGATELDSETSSWIKPAPSFCRDGPGRFGRTATILAQVLNFAQRSPQQSKKRTK